MIPDPEIRANRIKLYRFMLEHMSDADRIESTNRLCTDILNACVNGNVHLKEPGAYDLIKVPI
jgi:hypothetical protein